MKKNSIESNNEHKKNNTAKKLKPHSSSLGKYMEQGEKNTHEEYKKEAAQKWENRGWKHGMDCDCKDCTKNNAH